jgi:methanogenic corrinoid protein MtbC1
MKVTDEMREAFERAFEFATSDDEVVINRRAIRAGLTAVLAIVERDRKAQIIGVVEQAMRNASDEMAQPMTPKAVEHGIGVALAINKVLAEVHRELGAGVTEASPSGGDAR